MRMAWCWISQSDRFVVTLIRGESSSHARSAVRQESSGGNGFDQRSGHLLARRVVCPDGLKCTLQGTVWVVSQSDQRGSIFAESKPLANLGHHVHEDPDFVDAELA